jgi:uncharacterized protein (DUF305 family)
LLLAGLANEEEERMQRRLILIVTLSVLAAMTMQTQKHEAQSATSTVRWPTALFSDFTASTEKTFNQLMGEAMSVMHKGMHSAGYTGEPDHDFVTMMIPHHQGAIDMAKALLLYGKDQQLKRLAQEIIADQQNEVQLMQLWLTKRPGGDARATINK